MSDDLREPQIHGVLDCVADDHPLAWVSTYCVLCGVMVHGLPNEVMTEWVETGKGAWCLQCFARDFDSSDESWGLRVEGSE